MKVVDAHFLIDLMNGHAGAVSYYHDNSDTDSWVCPAVNYAETLIGFANHPESDLATARQALGDLDVVDIDERVVDTALSIASQVGSQGPYLDAPDAIAAAVARQHDAPLVSGDGDLTHPETRKVIDVETY